MKNNFLLVHLRHFWDKYLLGLLSLLYMITLGSLSIARHNAFASRFDLSNMDQTVYYTLHGHFFQLRLPDEFVSRFAVHADLILILLSPLFLLYDNVRILILSESVFLGLGAIPAYLISMKILKNKLLSLGIVVLYLLNPGMQWTDIYDFHGVAFAIPFLLFAFYFAYIKRWGWFAIFTFLSLLTKEQIALNIAMLGLFIFFIFKNKLVGTVTTLVGIIWFLSMVSIVMPYFTPRGIHWALEAYGEVSMLQIIQGYTNPTHFFQTFLFDKSTIDYYILLLKPFAFLPIIGAPWLLLSSPDIIINILRDTKTIQFHYDSGTTPALVIASIFGISYVHKIISHLRITKKYHIKIRYFVMGIALIISLRVNYHYSPLPTTPSCWCRIYTVTEEDKAFEKALQAIPKKASVTTSLEIRPHVSHREYAFTVPSATKSAQFIALITQNRIPGNYNPKEYENQLIPILLESKNHKVKFRSEHFYLFEKVKDI